LCLCTFSISISTSMALSSGTSGSTVCVSVCLTSTPRNSWEKWFLHLAKIPWDFVTKSPFSFVTILFLGWGKPWDAAVWMTGLKADVWTQDFYYMTVLTVALWHLLYTL
jgi:hypothetical protein